MRLESLKPENESNFYTCLLKLVGADFFFERVEPADESGFPDIYFVKRESRVPCEGTIELKYTDSKVPNLQSLCRGTQKAALLNYFAAGGRRRFALCYARGDVFLWDTADYARALRQDNAENWTTRFPLGSLSINDWLCRELEVE